jgi:hypothetical protein
MMDGTYVLMTITAPETEPRVRATGTEHEVKAAAFKILDAAISHNGTITTVESEYGYRYHISYPLTVDFQPTQVEQDLFIQRDAD